MGGPLKGPWFAGGQESERWKRNCFDPPVDPRFRGHRPKELAAGRPSIRPSTGPTAPISRAPHTGERGRGPAPLPFPCHVSCNRSTCGALCSHPSGNLGGLPPFQNMVIRNPPFPFSSGSSPVRATPMQPRSVLIRTRFRPPVGGSVVPLAAAGTRERIWEDRALRFSGCAVDLPVVGLIGSHAPPSPAARVNNRLGQTVVEVPEGDT